MTDINTLAIAGRLTRDSELKALPSGTAVCNFSIASNYSVKKNDQWQEEVSYFDCVLFGKRASALAEYLKKGKLVAIAGTLRQERWEKNGEKHSRVKIMVENIQLLGGKPTAAPEDDDEIPI